MQASTHENLLVDAFINQWDEKLIFRTCRTYTTSLEFRGMWRF